MLLLTRKLSQGIVIGGTITLTVVKIQGNRIGLGIQAPEGVLIRRSELTGPWRKPASASSHVVKPTCREAAAGASPRTP
jgi:carbon storage regulator